MITPIEKIDGIFIKRDDLFEVEGVQGGKVRTIQALLQRAQRMGFRTVASPITRTSLQGIIVARLCRSMGLSCVLHMPQGADTPEAKMAAEEGAEIIRHKAGYSSVIISRATVWAAERAAYLVPYMLECHEVVKQTAPQVDNLPDEAKRIVVPVGSGMSLAGVLRGVMELDRPPRILAIIIGADPVKRLDQYAPWGWRKFVNFETSKHAYKDKVEAQLGEVKLDPVYEAKCAEYLRPGDVLWDIGIRPPQLL